MPGPFASDSAVTRSTMVLGARIAYRVIGPDGAPPLVLAMRFRGVMDEWDPEFLDGLAATRLVYWFDSAGVGPFSGDVPSTIHDMAKILTAFIEAIDLVQVDLLGWSMGGYVVQIAALQRPDLVRRLIVAGSGPGGVSDAPSVAPSVWEAASRPVNTKADFLYLFFSRNAGRSCRWKRASSAARSTSRS